VKTFKAAPHSFLLFHPWFDTTVAYIDDFVGRVLPDRKETYVSKVWVADNGDGTYKNPVINADYSDPDAIRVGDDYYMVSSSFTNIPGIPILHSKDLVNWALIGHAIQKLPPYEYFSIIRHGDGVWAPSIRFHNGDFYIYYPEPELGIFLTKAKNIRGPWSEPVLVEGGKGLIDPCPLWDENGNLYLVHAYAGSRAGIKSILVVKKMNAEGTQTIDKGVVVYDGHKDDPTIEGPKFYKRNGYYYIFAPAGGVSTGWQTILRSKRIYGPYERKVVLDRGKTNVNGPHQGAWVDTESGEDWFIHFQDKNAYGRVVHLQPVKWVNDWPVIGYDKDGDGKGEPVAVFKKPFIAGKYQVQTPVESDEFSDQNLGLQWQWQANPKTFWAFPYNGSLRMFAIPVPDSINNYWMVPNVLLQKFPAEEFMATARIIFNARLEGERAGMIISGQDIAYLSVVKKTDGNYFSYSSCRNAADKTITETLTDLEKLNGTEFYLRVKVGRGGICEFSYSKDGRSYQPIPEKHIAKEGKWIGAKLGLFCTGKAKTNDPGYADVDWFIVEKI
jgi:beta-xylosidase